MSKNQILSSVATMTARAGSFALTRLSHTISDRAGEVWVFRCDEAKKDQIRHEISDYLACFYTGDTRDSLILKKVLKPLPTRDFKQVLHD